MIRYVDGWQLHAYVVGGFDGPDEVVISARHLGRDVFRLNRFSVDPNCSVVEATNLIEDRLYQVVGVEADGLLVF